MQDPTPESILPDTPEVQPDRETLIKAYEASDPPISKWENFGDANPAMHGGIWVVYHPESQEWQIVITNHVGDVGGLTGFSYDDPGEQYCQIGYIGFDDILTETGEWKDEMQQTQESLNNHLQEPAGRIVDSKLTKDIASLANSSRYFTEEVKDSRNDHEKGIVIEDSYEAILEYFGIEPKKPNAPDQN